MGQALATKEGKANIILQDLIIDGYGYQHGRKGHRQFAQVRVISEPAGG